MLSLDYAVVFTADPDGGVWGYAWDLCSNPELARILPGLPGVERRERPGKRLHRGDERRRVLDSPTTSAFFLASTRPRRFLAAVEQALADVTTTTFGGVLRLLLPYRRSAVPDELARTGRARYAS